MQRHTFIVRLVRDEDGALHGQLTEPVSGRQTLFTDAATLWTALLQELDDASVPPLLPFVKEQVIQTIKPEETSG